MIGSILFRLSRAIRRRPWAPGGWSIVALGIGTLCAAEPALRFGFSRQIFDFVNENDGRAALKTYVGEIVKSDGIEVDLGLPMFDDVSAMQRALAAGEIDILALPTDELLALPSALVTGPLLVAIVDDRPAREYTLVVRRDGAINDVAGLRGRRLIVQRGARAPFGLLWLDVLEMRAGLGPADRLLGEIVPVVKPSLAVLPVFFGQADAAVVTSRSLQVMGELNPQIAQRLRVLASSEEIVPASLCFRSGLPKTTIDRVVATACKIHTTPAGRQVMTIFQADRMDTLPLSAVDTARTLIDEHARLLAAWRGTPADAVFPANR